MKSGSGVAPEPAASPTAGESGSIAAIGGTRPVGHCLFFLRLDMASAAPSFFISGAKQKMAAFLLGVWVGAGGCGLGGGATGTAEVDRRTEVFVEAAEGLEEAVRVDSAFWQTNLFAVGSGENLEVDGSFRVTFRNLTDLGLEVRYDLRFLDRDEFLIDLFIPFGQPLLLEAGAAQEVEGTFSIRIRDERDIELIAIMRIVAKVLKREQDGTVPKKTAFLAQACP